MHHPVDGAADVERKRDVMLEKAKPGVIRQVLEVGQSAGDEIVHSGNATAFVEQAINQMAADEAGRAGDHYVGRLHGRRS
jgi:hypothetical protein